jgi:hypothetical protein
MSDISAKLNCKLLGYIIYINNLIDYYYNENKPNSSNHKEKASRHSSHPQRSQEPIPNTYIEDLIDSVLTTCERLKDTCIISYMVYHLVTYRFKYYTSQGEFEKQIQLQFIAFCLNKREKKPKYEKLTNITDIDFDLIQIIATLIAYDGKYNEMTAIYVFMPVNCMAFNVLIISIMAIKYSLPCFRDFICSIIIEETEKKKYIAEKADNNDDANDNANYAINCEVGNYFTQACNVDINCNDNILHRPKRKMRII